MRRGQFTEEQIIGVLKEAEAGKPTSCREHGIAEQTFYPWKAKYGGLEVSEARRLKRLEDENRPLCIWRPDIRLDNQALKGCSSEK